MPTRRSGRALLATASLLATGVVALATAAPAQADTASTFASTVAAIEALPYQPAYVPAGTDSAFPGAVANTAPAQDYTSGSIPGSPDSPAWPPAFQAQTIISTDGATLHGMVALQGGSHPGIVVAHGFNTHANVSVIRWAAMLAANGWNVAAFDQRDFSAEQTEDAATPQTFGWKEAQDILTAGTWLKAHAGVTSVGVVGFSEGAQNTILAVSHDTNHVFSAALTFSAPADQDTQVYSTAVPSNCQSPNCTYPATDALVTLVVPPYTQGDPCVILGNAAQAYSTSPYQILADESAFHAQTTVTVPLLNFYSNDDSLVAPFQASMMAGYEVGNPLQKTLLVQHGEHAYFFDRWWQQSAVLTYFKTLLPTDASITTLPTVNQTPGGAALASQLVDLGSPTRASADARVAPYICDTSQPGPAVQSAQPDANLSAGEPLALLAIGGAATAVACRRRRRHAP